MVKMRSMAGSREQVAMMVLTMPMMVMLMIGKAACGSSDLQRGTASSSSAPCDSRCTAATSPCHSWHRHHLLADVIVIHEERKVHN
jgi:hypothetical protein